MDAPLLTHRRYAARWVLAAGVADEDDPLQETSLAATADAAGSCCSDVDLQHCAPATIDWSSIVG